LHTSADDRLENQQQRKTRKMTKAEILAKIKASGTCGMGGGGTKDSAFPPDGTGKTVDERMDAFCRQYGLRYWRDGECGMIYFQKL
jgi:hypothetical protein